MKTLIPRLVAATIFVASLALTAPAAESLSVLLQKGIYAEETEGNLDSAIKIYEQIAAEASANRAVVAQAQYRLAVCYQKQGKREQANEPSPGQAPRYHGKGLRPDVRGRQPSSRQAAWN